MCCVQISSVPGVTDCLCSIKVGVVSSKGTPVDTEGVEGEALGLMGLGNPLEEGSRTPLLLLAMMTGNSNLRRTRTHPKFRTHLEVNLFS